MRFAARAGWRLPDFREYVRANLPPIHTDGACEAEIIEELALEIEEHYARALAEGLTAEEAWARIESQAPDWDEIAREMRLVLTNDAAPVRGLSSAAGVWEDIRSALRLPRRSRDSRSRRFW
jgi:hypothetical protein